MSLLTYYGAQRVYFDISLSAYVARPSILSTTDNYTGLSIGAAPTGDLRRFALFIHGYIGQFDSSERGSNIPTISGQAATHLYLAESPSAFSFSVQFDLYEFPTGTTAAINYIFDNNAAGAGLHVYRILTGPGGVALVGAGDSDADSTSLSVSVTPPPALGAIVCGAIPRNDGGETMAFGGTAGIDTVLQRADINSSEEWGTGFVENPSAGGVTATHSGTATSSVLGAISLKTT